MCNVVYRDDAYIEGWLPGLLARPHISGPVTMASRSPRMADGTHPPLVLFAIAKIIEMTDVYVLVMRGALPNSSRSYEPPLLEALLLPSLLGPSQIRWLHGREATNIEHHVSFIIHRVICNDAPHMLC